MQDNDEANDLIAAAGPGVTRAARPERRRAGWAMRTLAGVAGLGAAGLLFGFLVFAGQGTRPASGMPVAADAIVVLTGGARRLKAAGKLLKAGRAKHLLITGVNRIVSRRDLRRLFDIDTALMACCVTVDYAAQNTRGNAVQTRKWVRENGFTRIIVVTASYHMARSLAELGRVLPAADLIAYPVLPARFRDRPWWLDGRDTRLLAAEYLKFLPSAMSYGIDRMLATPRHLDGLHEQKAVAVQ